MPLFNEEELVAASIERVLAAPLPAGMAMEIIVVDDGSTDRSALIVEELACRHPEIVLLRHPANRGKGAAIRTAIEHARGEFAIVQDADLEYDPREFERLLDPLVDGRADVVYGSRFQGAGPRRVLYFWHALANHVLTTICNMAADLNLTDMETCYKAFRREVLESFELEEDRFGFEPEVTAKVAAGRWRVFEIGISYSGRTYDEGKKIGWKDGVRAIYCIARYSPPMSARRARREGRA